MKYSAAVLAFAAGVMATGNVTVTTEVVDKIVTYCPGATEITHGSKTYTVTEATTLTITDCPCTITKPVVPTSAPSAPPAPPANNGTMPGAPAPTGSNPAPTTPGAPAPTSPPTAGAAKVAGLSGLAGLAGLAAYFL